MGILCNPVLSGILLFNKPDSSLDAAIKHFILVICEGKEQVGSMEGVGEGGNGKEKIFLS